MAYREIHLSFFKSPKIGKLTREERLLFLGLTALADSLGRVRFDARLIRGQLYSYDDDIKTAFIEKSLQKFCEIGSILPAEIGGDDFFIFVNWPQHQSNKYVVKGDLILPEHIKLEEFEKFSKDFKKFQNFSKNYRDNIKLNLNVNINDNINDKISDYVAGASAPISSFSENNDEIPTPEKKTPPRGKQAVKTMPLSVDEVIEFAREKLPVANTNQCNDFFDTMTVKGWIVSGKPVKDWQATFRVWLNKGWLKPNYGETAAIKQEKPKALWQQKQENDLRVQMPAEGSCDDDDIPF